MSRGNPTIQMRLSASDLEQLDLLIAKRNAHAKGEPMVRSDFVRQAIREKIAKMRRSASPRPSRSKARKALLDTLSGKPAPAASPAPAEAAEEQQEPLYTDNGSILPRGSWDSPLAKQLRASIARCQEIRIIPMSAASR
jgi:hypothetical protein